jgi:uncharacterized membrane-anchored protein
MSRHKNIFVILAILLAVAAPLFTALNSYIAQKSYPVVKIEIEPYDPRDLLYGHYMTFGYKWHWDEKQDDKACNGPDCCLCVGEGDVEPKVKVMACLPDKPADCAHVIKGGYFGNRMFDIGGLNRYYVDETIALPLENLFRNKKEKFRVGLSIGPSGKPIMEKLYVGGQAVNDYVAEHYEELTKPLPPESTP